MIYGLISPRYSLYLSLIANFYFLFSSSFFLAVILYHASLVFTSLNISSCLIMCLLDYLSELFLANLCFGIPPFFCATLSLSELPAFFYILI